MKNENIPGVLEMQHISTPSAPVVSNRVAKDVVPGAWDVLRLEPRPVVAIGYYRGGAQCSIGK